MTDWPGSPVEETPVEQPQEAWPGTEVAQDEPPPSKAFFDRFGIAPHPDTVRRVGGAAWESAKEGFGSDPLGISEETWDKLAGHGPLRWLSDSTLRPASFVIAPAAHALFRGVAAVGYGLGGAVGQIAEEAGASQGMANRAKNETINAFNYALLRGDIQQPVTRLNRRPDGTVHDQIIGTLPRNEDFAATAETLGGERATVEQKLRQLYGDHGIHPSEVAYDAQHDPAVKGAMLDDTANLPERYVGPSKEKVESAIIEAYHGTPHEFEAFDIGKIGTGEGAQSYGHGLYFAENPEVASTYAKLSPASAKFDADRIQGGNTYRVQILADKELFLDWDKPLSEQAPYVQDRLAEIADRLNPGAGEQLRASSTKAGDWLDTLSHDQGPAEFSRILNEAGIPGIKYLDQGSRPNIGFSLESLQGALAKAESAGDAAEAAALRKEIEAQQKPTHNLVVFDDKDVKITHKNGQPVTAQERADVVDQARGGRDVQKPRTLPAVQRRGDTISGPVLGEGVGDATAIPPPPPEPPRPTAPPGPSSGGFGGRLAVATSNGLDYGKSLLRDLQMKTTPMAVHDASIEARAAAKDFANEMRLARYEWSKADEELVSKFTPEQLEKMWTAADEESVSLQRGHAPEATGLARLTPEERGAVEKLQERANKALEDAKALGIFKGEGLPSYVPRMVLEKDEGKFSRVQGAQAQGEAGQGGRNLRTSTPQLQQRKHLTAEETEAAAKAKFGESAELVRNIRTLPFATAKLEEAIAGRTLINEIKKYSDAASDPVVVEGAEPKGSPYKYFTVDHPAFKTYRPKFIEDAESGKLTAVLDQNGDMVFEKVPIYVRSDFEGPLKAVLAQDEGKIYNAAMSLKGKVMSAIMYSPIIHNAVEWGRALPAMPGKVATFRIYFEGNRAKNDPAIMHDAISNGLVPIGHRAAFQDITSIAEGPNLQPGRSWTSQLLAAIPGLFDKRAGDAVKRAVDKAGDIWHNTLLWDRVADLQMGLYKNMRDDLVAKGYDETSAGRVAAHIANRYAGALPLESMSQMSRKIANVTMFSRSFTLGNIGAMKDTLVGLPRDVQAQIMRDAPEALSKIKGLAQRKAVAIVAVDVALMYATNSILQDAADRLRGDKTLGQIGQGYVDRLSGLLERAQEHPFETVAHPFSALESLSSTSQNEPGKRDRILVGYQDDGTAIYMRNPTGKIGEEFIGYLTAPFDMVRRKLSTLARPVFQIMANDKGFGRKVYDPNAETSDEMMRNVGRIVTTFMESQVPADQFRAARDLGAGDGDATMNKLKLLGPFAGLTFSKGAPGGPAIGELYSYQTKHNFAVQEALPDIRKQIQRGDLAEAIDKMNELKIPVGLQRFYIRTTNDPQLRMTNRRLHDFLINASEEQKSRFYEALSRSAPRAPAESAPAPATLQ